MFKWTRQKPSEQSKSGKAFSGKFTVRQHSGETTVSHGTEDLRLSDVPSGANDKRLPPLPPRRHPNTRLSTPSEIKSHSWQFKKKKTLVPTSRVLPDNFLAGDAFTNGSRPYRSSREDPTAAEHCTCKCYCRLRSSSDIDRPTAQESYTETCRSIEQHDSNFGQAQRGSNTPQVRGSFELLYIRQNEGAESSTHLDRVNCAFPSLKSKSKSFQNLPVSSYFTTKLQRKRLGAQATTESDTLHQQHLQLDSTQRNDESVYCNVPTTPKAYLTCPDTCNSNIAGHHSLLDRLPPPPSEWLQTEIVYNQDMPSFLFSPPLSIQHKQKDEKMSVSAWPPLQLPSARSELTALPLSSSPGSSKSTDTLLSLKDHCMSHSAYSYDNKRLLSANHTRKASIDSTASSGYYSFGSISPAFKEDEVFFDAQNTHLNCAPERRKSSSSARGGLQEETNVKRNVRKHSVQVVAPTSTSLRQLKELNTQFQRKLQYQTKEKNLPEAVFDTERFWTQAPMHARQPGADSKQVSQQAAQHKGPNDRCPDLPPVHLLPLPNNK